MVRADPTGVGGGRLGRRSCISACIPSTFTDQAGPWARAPGQSPGQVSVWMTMRLQGIRGERQPAPWKGLALSSEKSNTY